MRLKRVHIGCVKPLISEQVSGRYVVACDTVNSVVHRDPVFHAHSVPQVSCALISSVLRPTQAQPPICAVRLGRDEPTSRRHSSLGRTPPHGLRSIGHPNGREMVLFALERGTFLKRVANWTQLCQLDDRDINAKIGASQHRMFH